MGNEYGTDHLAAILAIYGLSPETLVSATFEALVKGSIADGNFDKVLAYLHNSEAAAADVKSITDRIGHAFAEIHSILFVLSKPGMGFSLRPDGLTVMAPQGMFKDTPQAGEEE